MSTNLEKALAVARGLASLPETLARDVPQLARGKVWCRSCGAERDVDSAECIRTGWPRCCGATMTIDAPGERG